MLTSFFMQVEFTTDFHKTSGEGVLCHQLLSDMEELWQKMVAVNTCISLKINIRNTEEAV